MMQRNDGRTHQGCDTTHQSGTRSDSEYVGDIGQAAEKSTQQSDMTELMSELFAVRGTKRSRANELVSWTAHRDVHLQHPDA